MTHISSSLLSRSFLLSRQTSALRTQLDTLTQELTDGRVADKSRHLKGDIGPLSEVRKGLDLLKAYALTTTEAAHRTTSAQESLQRVTDIGNVLSSNLLLASNQNNSGIVESSATEAHAALDTMISTLNTQVAGRSLFAGEATDSPALASADVILTELRTATAGLTTADDVLAAIDAWFDTAGGGFETNGFLGSLTPAGSMKLSDTQSFQLSVTAADPAIRNALKPVAAAALLSDPTLLGGDLAEQTDLIRKSANRVLGSIHDVVTLRSNIGVAENRIETIQAQNAAQKNSLELAESDLLGADPYETSVLIEATQTQLETHYALTARLSRLSLVNYL